MEGNGDARQLVPHWDSSLVIASIAVSFLGAFTSTQLIVQAKTSRYFSAVIVWSILASLTFGFCSIWCLHFIAMLACELDVPIKLDAPLISLSAILAVCFTWLALASDILWDRHTRARRKQAALARADQKRSRSEMYSDSLRAIEHFQNRTPAKLSSNSPSILEQNSSQHIQVHDPLEPSTANESSLPLLQRNSIDAPDASDTELAESATSYSSFSANKSSRRTSGVSSSDLSLSLGRFASVKTIRNATVGNRNLFYVTGMALYTGFTFLNILKGFIWSLAITGMHYVGIRALEIPNGYCTLNTTFVILSAIISWAVCIVGCILLGSMETRLDQQFLFATIATAGVAAMHFTGMRAVDFWSTALPSDQRGYPPGLSVAIGSIAIGTCLAANGLLAHSATVARNKLVEIVYTRKNMWAAIAQKENAEAAALARSEFIASASHEIRSPIHQLQGYSDLLARSNLDDESRLLLHAIQNAIRSLSLITTTVLDWSRLEKGEAICRPTAVNVRRVCESVLNVLPSQDEDSNVELLIAVAPEVPTSLFIDETYLHRIIMNLLSNALKFTSSGFVKLQITLNGQDMVVTVEDTGCGIPESFLPDLFEPFKQAQSRGPQRGTGLGLSIVKQLLSKMKGTIEVQSKDNTAFPNESGTHFTATIPTQLAGEDSSASQGIEGKLTLAGDPADRALHGIRSCLETFGAEILTVEGGMVIPPEAKYVWTDVKYLYDHPDLLVQLRNDGEKLVLLPYDSDKDLLKLIEGSLPSHFIPLHTPLNFHKIIQQVNNPGKSTVVAGMGRVVRFASVVDLVEDEGPTSDQHNRQTSGNIAPPQSSTGPSTPPAQVVMIVEDNKINQRLGVKMLKTLGYEVMTADDGQEAIDLLLAHPDTVDAILMDQSMPRKDGLTATREIRELEGNGGMVLRKGKPIPILAVTAVVGTHAEAMCREAGADDFLPKPLSLKVLQKALETHLMEF